MLKKSALSASLLRKDHREQGTWDLSSTLWNRPLAPGTSTERPAATDNVSANAARPDSDGSPRRKRDHFPSSGPLRRKSPKMKHSPSRVWVESSSFSRGSAYWQRDPSGMQDGAEPAAGSPGPRQHQFDTVPSTLVPSVGCPLSLVPMKLAWLFSRVLKWKYWTCFPVCFWFLPMKDWTSFWSGA